jgi:hypothetical protein
VAVDILGDLLASLLPDALGGIGESAIAQNRLREGRVECGVRAISGRVNNIGPEWSLGCGTLTRGHMRFDPTLGIVGVREIEVTDVDGSRAKGERATKRPFPGASVWELVTPQGQLQWAVDSLLIEEAAAMLMPSGKHTPPRG